MKATGKVIVTVILVIAIVIVAALYLTSYTVGPSTPSPKKFKVALILPGRIDDLSWNEAAYRGLAKTHEQMSDIFDFDWTEGVYNVPDVAPALRDYAAKGYDLIIYWGAQGQDPIKEVAKDYPNLHFVIGCGWENAPNLAICDVRLEDGAYVMGVLAGLMTKTNKIGALGGVDIAEIHRGHVAYEMGAKSVNPDVKAVNLFTGDWTDATKAKTLCLSLYREGADIIWTSGDGISIGLNEAAKAARAEGLKVYVLQNEFDQNELAPDIILSGLIYDWSACFTPIIQDLADGKLSGKTYWATLANGGLKIAPYHGLESEVPQQVKDKVNQTVNDIIAGKIVTYSE